MQKKQNISWGGTYVTPSSHLKSEEKEKKLGMPQWCYILPPANKFLTSPVLKTTLDIVQERHFLSEEQCINLQLKKGFSPAEVSHKKHLTGETQVHFYYEVIKGNTAVREFGTYRVQVSGSSY